jgi:hypothetical protein
MEKSKIKKKPMGAIAVANAKAIEILPGKKHGHCHNIVSKDSCSLLQLKNMISIFMTRRYTKLL